MSEPGSAGAAREGVPESIGPYRVLRPLGRGGMGEVYLGERLEPRQVVALKVVKLGMDTRSVLARFEIEREALALMSHTNIARMLDAGATEGGQPWFAMEYVPGLPLTDYCARKKLGIEDRLQLFLQVCEGVQHAHQKGVIHRDLKPGNILVMEQDDRPVPKIIDFGLARAVDQTRWTHTLVTQEGRFLGTLPYMSPEQADRDALDVDTRTDVYSLGVILYELLTGEPPFTQEQLQQAGQFGMLQIIREQEPASPSQKIGTGSPSTRLHADVLGVDPKVLCRRLRGDLDGIARCALEKDRSARYPSVSALAANIRRHLRNESVEPPPPGALLRLRKWARRHRRGVGLGIAAAAAVVAVAGVWVWKQLEANEAQRVALEQERQKVAAQREIILASDPALLRELVRQADEDLWPLAPELRPDLGAWLERAGVLVARLGEHDALLGRLAAAGSGEAGTSAAYRLAAEREFVAALREFASAPEGAMASVAGRRREIDRLEELTLTGEAARATWQRELEAMRQSGRYPDLDLQPVFGLLPLGPDPDSGLWLFAHPQSGGLPPRDADGRIRPDAASCLVFVLVPGGGFTMGYEPENEEDLARYRSEGPRSRVRIGPGPFLLSKYEMTQAQWMRLAGYNISNFSEDNSLGGGATHPVERVSLDECRRYLRRFGLALPAEGQWEYACRGGRSGQWFGAEAELDRYANFADRAAREEGGASWPTIDLRWDDGFPITAPVGSLQPNPFGFCDMLGNVWEWCANAWTDDYSEGVADGDGTPVEALQFEQIDLGVTRGGCYHDSFFHCRASARRHLAATNREYNTGLRPLFPLGF